MTFAEARKAVVAIVGGGLTVAAGIYTTGTLGHVLAIALATVTAAGVYFTPNARAPLPQRYVQAAHESESAPRW
jgi:hypothetical protein